MDASIADDLHIQRVLAEYCQLCDDGDFDGLIARFAPDATFQFGGRTVEGHAGLRRWFEVSQSPERRGKHLSSNVVVDVDGDRAEAHSDFVFLAMVDGAPRPVLVGRYRDELRRMDGVWVIQRREATTLGEASSA